MKSTFSNYLSHDRLVMAFRVLVFFIIFFFNSFLNAQSDKALKSKVIVYKEVFKPGMFNIKIPFDSLQGSLTLKGILNDSGSITLNEIIPLQTITYNAGKEKTVQFFSGNNENPLKFIIKEVVTDSLLKIELLSNDTMSLIRKVIFTDGQPINATHNNIDPKDVLPDEELAKWKTNIRIDSSDINNGNLKCVVTFNRLEPFTDTLFLPFEQVFIDWQSLKDAYISINTNPKRSINYARYKSIQTNDFLIENVTTVPYFELNFVVNDIYNRHYDQMLWTIVEIREEKVYPLKMLYENSQAINIYYEYDKSRTQLPGNNKKVPDSTFFKADIGLNSAIRFNNKQGDTLQLRTFATPGGEFLIRNSTGFVNELEFLTFQTYNQNESFRIKDKFYKYRYFLNGSKKEKVLLDSTPIYKDYHGFDFYINSSDSMTIIPSDAINMAKLNFWATNSYKTAEPWHYVDTIAPKITLRNPADKDSNISVNTTVSIKFDEEINPDLINSNNFTLRINSQIDTITTVVGSYYYKDSTVIFTPKTNLFYDTEYIVEIENITDLAGNKLTDFCYTFKTEKDTTVKVSELIYSKLSLQVYPNPAKDKLVLIFNLRTTCEINFNLYNTLGFYQTIYSTKNLSPGTYHIQTDIEKLPKGLYIIRDQNNLLMQKFIKY